MLEKAKKVCEDAGVTLTLCTDIHPDRMETLWYGGVVATIEYNGKVGKISAIGDVCFNIRDDDKSYSCMYRNTTNTGVSSGSWLFDHIASDKEFETYLAVGLLEWLNNNWISFSIFDGDTCIYHDEEEDSTNLKEVFGDMTYYVEKLKNLA